jgi:hypothetical protein
MNFYEALTFQFGIQQGIDLGWCVPPVCEIARVADLDLTGIRITAGDYNQKDLADAIEQDAVLHRVAVVTKQKLVGQTVVFFPSVNSARGGAQIMRQQYGLEAGWVSGEQPEEERREVITAFKTGEMKVLCNCQVVAVGFDVPATTTCILARPTRSRIFWLQAIGRVTRPLPGVVDFPNSTPETRKAAIAASAKPNFRVIDMTDASLDHRLITAVDEFVRTDDPELKAKAKQIAAKTAEPMTPDEILAEALKQQESEKLAKEIEERRRQMEGEATGTVVSRDVDLRTGGKRSVGTYTNPLKGKFAGQRMCDLPDYYVAWGEQKMNGWVKAMFRREKERRRGLTERSVG